MSLIFCLILTNLLSVRARAAEPVYELLPDETWFTSDSTNNGRRRFLAIGNFFDTTNDAFYHNSNAFLSFTLPSRKDIVIKEARLVMYKYANAHTGNVPVQLSLGEKSLGVVLADNGDYDFDKLQFNITDEYIHHYGESITFTANVNHAAYKEGIAVCSGNLFDGLCTSEYAPRIVVRYADNTMAEVEMDLFPNKSRYNSNTITDSAKCSDGQGCIFTIAANIKDKESNASLRLRLKDDLANIVEEKTISAEDSEQVDFAVSDGVYQIEVDLFDGFYSKNIASYDFEVDTTPPEPPVIVTSSQYGSRAGVVFTLEPYAEKEVLSISVCNRSAQDACGEVIAEQRYQKSLVKFKANKPLEDATTYTYQLRKIDQFGNYSQSVYLDIKQRNDLVYAANINVESEVISPANRDGRFDDTKISFSFSEEVKDLKISYSVKGSSKAEQLNKQETFGVESSTFEFTFTGQDSYNELKNNLVEIKITGEDKHGYPLADDLPIYITIDNQPPILRT